MIVTNNTSNPVSGWVRVGQDKPYYSFESWETKEVSDGIALALYEKNKKRFVLSSHAPPVETIVSEDQSDLRAQVDHWRNQVRGLKASNTKLRKRLERLES